MTVVRRGDPSGFRTLDACALFTLALCAYANTLPAGFTFDDQFAILTNADVLDGARWFPGRPTVRRSRLARSPPRLHPARLPINASGAVQPFTPFIQPPRPSLHAPRRSSLHVL